VGFTLAEAKRLIASRKRSPVAWRTLAVRKSEELQHRIAREEAARQAIEHSLVCPEDHFLDCPNFWATVKGVLAGVELADAHSGAHATAATPRTTNTRTSDRHRRLPDPIRDAASALVTGAGADG
jgi:hypothetical protein